MRWLQTRTVSRDRMRDEKLARWRWIWRSQNGILRQKPRGRAESPEAKMLFPISIITGSVAATASATYYATCAVRSQWLGATICRGRADTNEVALTFDDGPCEDT